MSQALRDFLPILVPTRRWYGIQLLLNMNIFVFLAMVLTLKQITGFRADELLAWGANSAPALHGVGVLRLLSYQFIHGGPVHLLNNLVGVTVGAVSLQPVAANGRLIACYLLSGIGGGITSAAIHKASISVGASASVFGMLTAALVLLLLREPRIQAMRPLILAGTWSLMGINLVMGAMSPHVDNAAHVGGVITGGLVGLGLYVLSRFEPNREMDR